MKKLPYIRHILILIVYMLMWLPNAIISPLLWMFGIVNRIRGNKTPFFIWFVNTDEPTDLENNYGDDSNRAKWGISDIANSNAFKKFWWYCKWNVFRNSYFYFKMHVIKPLDLPSEVIKVKINTTDKLDLHLCNYNDRGKIHIIEKRDDTLYFRYSFTKEIKFLWIFGKRIWNVQLGVNGQKDAYGNKSTNRYLYKSKFKKLENDN